MLLVDRIIWPMRRIRMAMSRGRIHQKKTRRIFATANRQRLSVTRLIMVEATLSFMLQVYLLFTSDVADNFPKKVSMTIQLIILAKRLLILWHSFICNDIFGVSFQGLTLIFFTRPTNKFMWPMWSVTLWRLVRIIPVDQSIWLTDGTWLLLQHLVRSSPVYYYRSSSSARPNVS